jgi:hypothetical protein
MVHLEFLLTIVVKMAVGMNTNQERAEASQSRLEAKMNTNHEKIETNQEKMETAINVVQERRP